jgi:hypothetical protein
VILDPQPIGYTGIARADVVLALGQEGVDSRRALLGALRPAARVIHAAAVRLPPTPAQVETVDLRALGVGAPDTALAGLALLAAPGGVISPAMLAAALDARFDGAAREAAGRVTAGVLAAVR